MINGDKNLGLVATGAIQTSSGNYEICSWTTPINTTARIEAHCIVQKILNKTSKSSYKLIAIVRRDNGNVAITSGPTVVATEESSTAMTITMTTSGSNIVIQTATPDGNIFRATCFMKVYGIEQFRNEYSLLFDGSNEYVTMENVFDFDKTDAFSISCWVKKLNTAANAYIISKFDATPIGWGMKITATGTIEMLLYRTSTTNETTVRTVSTSFDDGNWHHIVATMDGTGNASGITIYANGSVTPVTTVYNTLSSSISNTGSLNFSGRTNGASQVLNGYIDEVSIYDKELSLSEVQAIYNSNIPIDIKTLSSASNMVGYWRCGDGDTYPTILDQ